MTTTSDRKQVCRGNFFFRAGSAMGNLRELMDEGWLNGDDVGILEAIRDECAKAIQVAQEATEAEANGGGRFDWITADKDLWELHKGPRGLQSLIRKGPTGYHWRVWTDHGPGRDLDDGVSQGIVAAFRSAESTMTDWLAGRWEDED